MMAGTGLPAPGVVPGLREEWYPYPGLERIDRGKASEIRDKVTGPVRSPATPIRGRGKRPPRPAACAQATGRGVSRGPPRRTRRRRAAERGLQRLDTTA